MKSIVTFVACSLIFCMPLSAVAQDAEFGPSTIGGAGVGYAVDGPDSRETFLVQFAGLRLFSPAGSSVYACYQRGTIEGLDVGGSGAKFVLADRWRQAPDFTWLLGLGFLDNIKSITDGTDLKTGLTFEGGITYDASRWIEFGLFASAWERGPEPIAPTDAIVAGEDPSAKKRGGRVSWLIVLTGIIKDPLSLIPGVSGGT